MCSYLEDYRARLGTWAARISRRTAQGRDSNRHAIRRLEYMLLCAAALAVLLVIGGLDQSPGPGTEAENVIQHSATRVDAGFTTAADM
jgi:hypothetical protein